MGSPPRHEKDDASRPPSEQEAGGPRSASPATHTDEEEFTEQGVVFEPFEPGNLWTQRHPTQFQRKQWRKRVYLEQEEEEDGVEIVSETQAMTPPAAAATSSTATAYDIQEQENEGRDQPWWSEGKTVPLLNEFDSDRRSFYLAQAGITGTLGDGSVLDQNKHSQAGREREVIESQQIERGGVAVQRPVAVILGKDLRNLQQQSAAPSSTIVTPGKKTWNAVWGQNGQRSVTSSEKKRKSSTSPTKRPAAAAASATPSRTARGAKTGRRGGRRTT